MRSLISAALILYLSSLPTSAKAFIGDLFPEQPAGCQYPANTYGRYIYFTSPKDTAFTFAIYTGWKQYYPTILRAALVLDNFTLADPPNPNVKGAICNWTVVGDAVTTGFVNRGLVSVHGSAPNTFTQTSKPVTPSQRNQTRHILNRVAPPMHRSASPGTVQRIQRILFQNAPNADFALYVFEIVELIWAITIITMVLAGIHAILQHRALRQRLREEQAVKELDGIELVPMHRKNSATPPAYPFVIEQLQPPNPFLDIKRAQLSTRFGGSTLRSSSLYSRSIDGVTLRE